MACFNWYILLISNLVTLVKSDWKLANDWLMGNACHCSLARSERKGIVMEKECKYFTKEELKQIYFDNVIIYELQRIGLYDKAMKFFKDVLGVKK